MAARETRIKSAIQLRNAALVKIKAEGEFENIKNFGPAFTWSSDEMSMILRSPFQKLPELSIPLKIQAFVNNLEIKEQLPWGLDIWARTKMMSIMWHDDGRVDLISFKRGDWEKDVLGWAHS